LKWRQPKQARRILFCHDGDFGIRDTGLFQSFKKELQPIRVGWIGRLPHIAR